MAIRRGLVSALVLMASALCAQESRGTIAGCMVDHRHDHECPSGAVRIEAGLVA